MSSCDRFEQDRRRWRHEMATDPNLYHQRLDVLTRAFRHHYPYQWNWLGMPVIQMPEDLIATQEVIWETRPDVIIETGIARGGSLVFYASLQALIGNGRVIGIEIDLRPAHRLALDNHPLRERMTIIDGGSTEVSTLDCLHSYMTPEDRIMVVLDANHTEAHVCEELAIYAPFVSPGNYLIVCDTLIEDLPDELQTDRPWGPGNSPATAVHAFLARNDDFARDRDLEAKLLLSSHRGGYLRRAASPYGKQEEIGC